ncbi:MAG: prolyl oligopeptidase family serine peptidase [Phycisphaerae bacterium]
MPRLNITPRLGLVACFAAAFAVAPAAADPGAIRANLKAFFHAPTAERRRELAAQIAADRSFERARLSTWLHEADLFEPLEPGPRELPVTLDTDEKRLVTLRIPASYDAKRKWPLIYALHGTGGAGPQIIRYLEHVLGAQVDEFVIAAPTAYGQRVIHEPGPASDEHPAVIRALRELVHVDSDRVYLTGYSLGGHTSWTVATLHADQFAAAIPIAGSLVLPEVDKLWDVFVPNLAHTHVLCCWGARDTRAADGTVESEHGGVAGMNRKLLSLAVKAGVSAIPFEDPEKAHGDIVPPAELLANALAKTRAHYPAKIEHTFRRTHQSSAYWVEAAEWKGPAWEEQVFRGTLKAGENPRDAMVRMIRDRLGKLDGEHTGQSVRVNRKRVDDLTIWFGDAPDIEIDWAKPVVVNVSGKKVFDDRLEPDLLLCLNEARRTYDFDRLRWAAIRVKSGEKPRVVRGTD